MDRGYVDFERLYTLHQAGAFFVTGPSRLWTRDVYSALPSGHWVICDQRVMLNGFCSARKPRASAAHSFQGSESGKTLVFLTNNTTLPGLTIAALYKSRWQVGCSSVDQAAPAHQEIPGHQRERGEDANLVRHVSPTC